MIKFSQVAYLIIGLLYPMLMAASGQNSYVNARKFTKIVLIAGEKSHPGGTHEYIKTVRLIKTMLDHSTLTNLKTEVHLHGWPQNEKTLNDADLILFISDGCDGYSFGHVPFMTPKRMKVMERQMKRGCGISLLHFSTFADYKYGQQMLKWSGGYFDWQNAKGERHSYSALKELEGDVNLPSAAHPISNGVKPFRLKDEFYFNMRFPDDKKGLLPVAAVNDLKGSGDWGNVVSWALQRSDGGRSFCSTMNHYYSNWENENYRKLMLNGIVWAAGCLVPANGIEANYYSDLEITKHLFGKSIKALMITDTTSAGKWAGNTLLIKNAIESNSQFLVDISSNINDIWQYDLRDYQFIIFNKKDTTGINSYSKKILEDYLSLGGGMISLPFYHKAASGKNTWTSYYNIFRREINDDPAGLAEIKHSDIKINSHFISNGLNSVPKLRMAYGLVGESEVFPVFYESSGIPLLWTYQIGKGRVVQTVISFEVGDLKKKTLRMLLKRCAAWVSFSEASR